MVFSKGSQRAPSAAMLRASLHAAEQASKHWPGLAIENKTKKRRSRGGGGAITVGLGWVYVTRNRYIGALSSGAEEIRPSSVPAIALRKKKKIMKNKKRRYEPEGVYARGGVWFPYSSPRP